MRMRQFQPENCCRANPRLESPYRYVWSAAEMQAKNEEWQMVCANVFGLEWSQRLRAMMDVRSLLSL
jgi:hypothetical protein